MPVPGVCLCSTCTVLDGRCTALVVYVFTTPHYCIYRGCIRNDDATFVFGVRGS